MKSLVIYLSLTDNTKKVAKAIQNGINSSEMQCDLITVKEAKTWSLKDYDLIGIGSPVWGGPPPIQKFLHNLPVSEGKHAFVFCTHGVAPQQFYPAVANALHDKGFVVIGYGDWFGSLYLPPFPKPYLTDGHPDEIDLEEARQFGKEMVERSKRISAGETQLIPPLPEVPVYGKSKFNKPAPKLNPDKCLYPKCTLCMDNCPMEAINLTESPVVFARGCRFCYFCEIICPTGAVEVDYDPDAKILYGVKDKYMHALDEPESTGKFRRLVPLDKVGFETPFYKVYSKHPRYIIPK